MYHVQCHLPRPAAAQDLSTVFKYSMSPVVPTTPAQSYPVLPSLSFDDDNPALYKATDQIGVNYPSGASVHVSTAVHYDSSELSAVQQIKQPTRVPSSSSHTTPSSLTSTTSSTKSGTKSKLYKATNQINVTYPSGVSTGTPVPDDATELSTAQQLKQLKREIAHRKKQIAQLIHGSPVTPHPPDGPK